MIEVVRYKCEFCDKIYKNKCSAIKHEKRCYANPETKSCRSCKHAIKDSNTVYVPPRGNQNYGDADYEESYFYCERTNDVLMGLCKPLNFKTNCQLYKKGKKLF